MMTPSPARVMTLALASLVGARLCTAAPVTAPASLCTTKIMMNTSCTSQVRLCCQWHPLSPRAALGRHCTEQRDKTPALVHVAIKGVDDMCHDCMCRYCRGARGHSASLGLA